jgi:hypothetical protein
MQRYRRTLATRLRLESSTNGSGTQPTMPSLMRCGFSKWIEKNKVENVMFTA